MPALNGDLLLLPGVEIQSLFHPFHLYTTKIVHSASIQTQTLLCPQLAARLLASMMGLASWTALTLIVAPVWVATRAKTASTVSWRMLIICYLSGFEVSFQGSCTQVALLETLWVSHFVQKPKASSHNELLPRRIIVHLMRHKRTRCLPFPSTHLVFG